MSAVRFKVNGGQSPLLVSCMMCRSFFQSSVSRLSEESECYGDGDQIEFMIFY